MKFGLSTFALVVCLAGAACGGGGDASTAPIKTTPPPTGNGNAQVAVTNDAFGPTSVTIKAGATVTWTWNTCTSDPYDPYGTGTCVEHQIGFDDGQTSALQSSGSFDRTFDIAGTYPYHCLVHGTIMSGTIVVQ
jgi:plastocyanin